MSGVLPNLFITIMEIAGYRFRPLKGQTLFGGPGIYIYMHQATGMCFVAAMRNARTQRSRNNYPALLKELLKINKSEVLLFLAELPKDTKEALYLASRAVVSALSEKGVLYKRPKPNRGGMYRQLPGEEERFTVWEMKHKVTGAVFYFSNPKGQDREKVMAKVSQRMLTFNNYVLKTVVNANRAMYYFIKFYGFTDIDHWEVIDHTQDFAMEHEASKYITKLSRDHLVESTAMVLNRISDIDALYFHNVMLKLPHKSMEEYLRVAS
jgi:hypothetical protein